MFKKEKSNLA